MPLERERIEKWSLGYHLLKHYVDFAFHTYYKVIVKGVENIDFSKPLIFAPNHQNALMDALAVLCVRKWQPVFLARSDVFKGRFLTKVLTFLKILPVYRIRDGYSTLQHNDATFRKTLDVFNNRNGLVILPEGSHHAQKKLRPLKKGIARIAFQAEEASDFQMGICIVPVGLEFEDYHRPGSQLLIMFGEPIPVEKFVQLYKENPPQAFNAFMAEVSQGMKREMIHISDDRHHDEILTYLDLIVSTSSELANAGAYEKFEKKQAVANALEKMAVNNPSVYADIISELQSLIKLLRKQGLIPRYFQWMHRNTIMPLLSTIALFVTLPLYMISLLNILIPVGLSYLAGKKAKDHHFISSFRFVVGLLAFPVFFLMQTIVVSIYFGIGAPVLMYILFFPISIWITFYWKNQFSRITRWWKLMWLRVTKPAYCQTIIQKTSKLLQTSIVS